MQPEVPFALGCIAEVITILLWFSYKAKTHVMTFLFGLAMWICLINVTSAVFATAGFLFMMVAQLSLVGMWIRSWVISTMFLVAAVAILHNFVL